MKIVSYPHRGQTSGTVGSVTPEFAKKEILSDFHQLIVDRFGYHEAKFLHLELGLPPHPVTKAYKSPEKTPHKILIAFCEVLNMHPYELIKDYQVGVLRISDIEKVYHQKGYHTLNQS